MFELYRTLLLAFLPMYKKNIQAMDAWKMRFTMNSQNTDLSLLHESLNQVLVDDAVGGSKEGEHVGDEVPLVVLQVHPVTQVLVKGFI